MADMVKEPEGNRITNTFKALKNLFWKDTTVNAMAVQTNTKLSAEEMEMYKLFQVIPSELRMAMDHATMVNLDRSSFYRELDRAITHWMVSSAMELYAEVATNYNQVHNATVWVTSENMEIMNVLNKFLSFIGIEERIFDWTWNTGTFGDFFAKPIGIPGQGVIHVQDDDHPMNVSRVDYNGRLVGFYSTPFGEMGETSADLMSPWQYVHFKLLGAKRKRSNNQDPYYTEFRSVSVVSTETRKLGSNYGVSLAADGIPEYKRLRLSEDSLLMARLSKGILKYMYKVKVPGNSPQQAKQIMDQYSTVLKRMRAMQVDPNKPTNFEDRLSELAANEDILLPVFGETDDVVVEKLGGETDIRWIRDIEKSENALATALRVPLPLLGGFSRDLPGGMNTNNLEQYGIRFGRSAGRLQRAMIAGITRLCQIHLAYLNMPTDPRLFQVQMAQTSSAEERDLADALDKNVGVADKVIDYVEKCFGEGEVDLGEIFNYLNQKILKLTDFDIQKFKAKVMERTMKNPSLRPLQEHLQTLTSNAREWGIQTPDHRAALPNVSGRLWEKYYSGKVLNVNTIKTEPGRR